MSDTLMRQWQMLRLIPRHPQKISTADLKQRLADAGFEITLRTIQRDLMRLDLIRSQYHGWNAGRILRFPPG